MTQKMAGIKELNIDILTQIVEYIDIDTVEVACRCLMPSISKANINSIINRRQSPILLLKRLVDEPEALLLAMGFSGVLLSGSQATEYFYPGIVSEKSDWDFYCPPDPILVSSFQNFLETIGVVWTLATSDSRHGIFSTNDNYYGLATAAGKIDNGATTQTIELIMDLTHSLPFNIIVKFHSSIVQCFISAFGAVCMHRNLTMKGRSIAWKSRINNEKHSTNAEEARRKYISRGVKYTSYEWYTGVSQDNENHYISTAIVNTRSRSIEDENCKVVPFTRYYSKEIRNLGILYDIHDNELSIFEHLYWLEDPYECTPTPGLYTLQFSETLPPITLVKLCTLHPQLVTVLKSQDNTKAVGNP